MGFYERIDARGVRETGRPVSFIPKGALTHHPEGAVVLPAATVRSARRMRLLREPYGQCHITAVLLSLATQSAMCFASSSKQLFPEWKQFAACLRKPATGSFIAERVSQFTTPFSFCEKETKKDMPFQRISKSERESRYRASLERKVKINGNLSFRSESG